MSLPKPQGVRAVLSSPKPDQNALVSPTMGLPSPKGARAATQSPKPEQDLLASPTMSLPSPTMSLPSPPGEIWCGKLLMVEMVDCAGLILKPAPKMGCQGFQAQAAGSIGTPLSNPS